MVFPLYLCGENEGEFFSLIKWKKLKFILFLELFLRLNLDIDA